MAEKYKPGTCISYDTYGICKIERIELMSVVSSMPKREYYVLSVLNSPASTYYVPCEGEAAEKKLRLPLTKSEIENLLVLSKNENIQWAENRQVRHELFNKILNGGITPSLVALIRCIYERKVDLSNQNNELSSSDEHYFSSAEKLIREEFAFSLGIKGEEVASFISSFYAS